MASNAIQIIPTRARGYVVVVAAMLMCTCLSMENCLNNINSYLLSYFVFIDKSSIREGALSWIFTVVLVATSITVIFTGHLEDKLGSRAILVLGCLCTCAAQLTAYWTVSMPVALFATFPVLIGIGVGLPVPVAIATCVRWFPHRAGLVSGLTMAGGDLGTLPLTKVITAFVNPWNYPPVNINGTMYFTQATLLNRFPIVFLLGAGAVAAVQALAILFWGNRSECYEALGDETSTGSSSLKHVLSDPVFVCLFVLYGFRATVDSFGASYYKLFGLTVTTDDKFVTTVVAIAALFGGAGRVLWGILGDRFGFEACLTTVYATSAALLFTMPACKLGGKPMLFIWVCLLNMNTLGSSSLYALGVKTYLGKGRYTTKIGLVFSGELVGSSLMSLLDTLVFDLLHYNGIFFLLAAIQCFGTRIIAFVAVRFQHRTVRVSEARFE